MYGCFFTGTEVIIISGTTYNICQTKIRGSREKKRYPTYKRKYKRKKQPMRKILTAIILCVTLAVCNGWMPPRSLKEVKDQSRIFGQVFLTYIEENAQILWEDVSESASDAVAGLLKQSQTKTGEQTESVSLDQIPEYSDSPYVEINGNVPSFSDEKSAGPAYEFYSELDSLGRCGYAESKVTPELMPVEERGAIRNGEAYRMAYCKI